MAKLETSEARAELRVELLEKETCFSGFLSVVRYRLRHALRRGGMSRPVERELLVRRNAAAVLPYDPRRDQVVLVEQFRVGPYAAGYGGWTIELVAGIVERGEIPVDVARREAAEEAGLTLSRTEEISAFMSSPGGSSEVMTVFIAEVDATRVQGVHGVIADGEETTPRSIPFQNALDLVESREIFDATTIIALQWLRINRSALRERWGATHIN